MVPPAPGTVVVPLETNLSHSRTDNLAEGLKVQCTNRCPTALHRLGLTIPTSPAS
jgi:hypothetical protein